MHYVMVICQIVFAIKPLFLSFFIFDATKALVKGSVMSLRFDGSYRIRA